jgi:hypothetical protein
LQEAIKQCGDCSSKANLHKNLGLIECKSGNVQTGEKDLLQAKSLNPQDPDISKALDTINWVRKQQKGP